MDMHILFDAFLTKRFLKNVAPALRARGVPLEGDDEEARKWLERWFCDKTVLWELTKAWIAALSMPMQRPPEIC
jgi:hypothetical protein